MNLYKIGGVAMSKENNTKFIVGDEVTILSNGSHGTVKEIVSYFVKFDLETILLRFLK